MKLTMLRKGYKIFLKKINISLKTNMLSYIFLKVVENKVALEFAFSHSKVYF